MVKADKVVISVTMATVENEDSVTKYECVCKIKKQNYNVILTSTTLCYQAVDNKKGASSIRISDIISVKLQKSGDKDVLRICYAQQQKKLKLKKCVLELTADDFSCAEQLKYQLQQLIKEDARRPGSLLVIVNPISGRRKGPSIYTKIVAPLFEEAGIKTHVIVTEKAHHTEEILSTYDLKSINGLVLVGGDGTYHEAVNGLMRRLHREQGLDIDDVDSTVPDIQIPMGLIPTGTGNGIALQCYGGYDPLTAALTIIIGFKAKYNMFSVHSDQRFIGYSILLVGCAMWGDIIHVAENRRSQGVLRYFTTMGQFGLSGRLRECQYTVEYKTTEKNEDGTEGDKNKRIWKACTETVVGGCIFSAWFDVPGVPSFADQGALILTKPCSRLSRVTFFFSLMTFDSNLLNRPEVIALPGTEWKMCLNNRSEPTSETGILEHIINIDGEPVTVPKPEYHIKFLPKKVTLFCNMSEVTGRPKT
ncbi:hypothetical protein ACF0H5_004220 [Mactra antiquata]